MTDAQLREINTAIVERYIDAINSWDFATMRELLADMLMEQNQPKDALKEYETSLKNAPMRLRGFYGAAKAADAVGDTKAATFYFEKVARLTKNADTERPEILEARKRVASK